MPRLWATRRIGHLVAERRRSSDNRELDEEIRQLALRYGLPSDVSSYLVLEPGAAPPMIARGTVGSGAATDLRGSAATVRPEAAAPRQRNQMNEVMVTSAPAAFESARTAAAQRDASSLAVTDGATPGRRALSGRVFELTDSSWVQVSPSPRPGARTMARIKPYSAAYFEIMDAIPELRAVFALGERVTVFGRSVTLQLDQQGTEQLSETRLRELVSGW